MLTIRLVTGFMIKSGLLFAVIYKSLKAIIKLELFLVINEWSDDRYDSEY